MRRWQWFLICAILGLVMLIGGLLVPAHLRAIDVSVIQTAGESSPTLIERAGELVREKQLGAAEMLLRAARELKLPDTGNLGVAITNLAAENAELRIWGASPPVGLVSSTSSSLSGQKVEKSKAHGEADMGSKPVTGLIVQRENRERSLELLHSSSGRGVQDVLNCRTLTNTVVFSPSQSASGQAFDVAIAVCGLLLKDDHLTPGMRDAVFKAALRANYRNDSESFEQMLLDFMSLGQRMSWGQLTTFIAHIQDPETLRSLADQIRNADEQLPVIFSAVVLSEKPSAVAGYLTGFSRTGTGDLGTSLRFGEGGVTRLMQSHKRLNRFGYGGYLPAWAGFKPVAHFTSSVCGRLPWVALTVKWLLYLLSGFFIAAAMHFARRPASALEQPLQVRGFHVAREGLFALGFLLVVLLLSEPFLSQSTQKVESHFRLRLPTVGGAIPAGSHITPPSFMNQANLLTLLLFFVLQGLIYTACVVKLAEIRRQKVPPGTKLKLLENEEHLFDAGLYLGFVGTIVSLILVSMGITHFSLMAAYSSTSFGIIFVSFFKIFHLRAARRKLLLQAEGAADEPVRAPVASAFTAQS